MKKIGHIGIVILFLCYFFATIVESDFWGNLLSPIITLIVLVITFIAFYYKISDKSNRIIGLLLCLGIFTWEVADILWAVCDLILHTDPQNNTFITICYSLTNFFLTFSLTVYGYYILRKWNVAQVILDSAMISYFVIEFIWIVFLNENVDNIIVLKSDWLSTTCIILDILSLVWISIWYISSKDRIWPFYLKIYFAGLILFSVTDLFYYHDYFYSTYEPNSIIDAIYVLAFLFIAVAALNRLHLADYDESITLNNIRNNGKGYAFLIVPVILILMKRISLTQLLQFVIMILIYNILTVFIQKNIHKEILLLEEQEHNSYLEEKVRQRTEELEEKNKVLQHLLDQDFVTGLKNRRYLLSHLDRMIASLNEGETIVLLYIDVNRFKMITTMYGYYVGDMILYEIAEKLHPLKEMAERTILTSYRDDTFIFAAVGPYDYQQGYEYARKAIQLCSDTYQIDEYQIRVTVNVGISILPNDASNKEDLIKHADIAMSQARLHGFNMVRGFDANLSDAVFRKNMIEIMLKRADLDHDFMIYYQPQLLTSSKELIGFEALLRWRTPSGEMIAPSEFIPVAEETGYILPIGSFVMTNALRQLVEWNKRYQKKIMIGINVSLKQLNSENFIKELKNEITRLGVEPEWIDLEITETLQFHENPVLLTMLESIRGLGIKISIDDFGTGYSSLHYFKNLPIDRIKIAKELVDYIHTDQFSYKLVEAIIMLSKAKGICVIAEGVETKEQWETLKQLQCDEVQGYYFGRPEPVAAIEAAFASDWDNSNE